jgi:CMP-N,N'-diacetyllegionaminic acid synthase
MSQVICIIPLRSKSKGLKNKNICKISKLPMCLYAIISAYKSKIFKKIYICYDSIYYKKLIFFELSKLKMNVDKFIFFKRSAKSSTDNAQTEEVLLELFSKLNLKTKYCCLIQATSPLLNQNDIKKGFELFRKKKYDSIFSGSSFYKFVWKNYRNKYFPINYNPRKRSMRQNINLFVKENGAFYFFQVKKFLKIKSRLFGKVGAFIMPEDRSVEVDSKNDLETVKIYLKLKG